MKALAGNGFIYGANKGNPNRNKFLPYQIFLHPFSALPVTGFLVFLILLSSFCYKKNLQS